MKRCCLFTLKQITKMSMGFFIVFLLLIAVKSNVFAAELHVAKTGSDTNPGTEAQPFLTINKAAQEAYAGDTVIVDSGEYRELVQPLRGGTSEENRITYKAKEGAKVIIKGSEKITTWEQYSGNTWRTVLDNSFFGSYNPYTAGHGLNENQYIPNYNCGDVYLNGEAYYQRPTLDDVLRNGNSWYSTVNSTTTTIYANFDGVNPNDNNAEINARKQCFAPSTWGLGYITVDGFTVEHAANMYSDFPGYPQHAQAGAISVYGGLKWIIENCTVINARTIGIDIGLGCDEWAGNKGTAVRTNYRNIDQYGSHIVRNCFIQHCGQSGIAGVFSWNSQILNNTIEGTNYRNEFVGAETAGIKLHYDNDGLIEGNYVKDTKGSITAGIWTDWGNQGIRITKNILVNNSNLGYYAEAVVGPILVDNNVFVNNGATRMLDAAGIVFVHNLFYKGTINFDGSGRDCYVFEPHSLNARNTYSSPQYFRWLNNIFIGCNQPTVPGTNNIVDFNCSNVGSNFTYTATSTSFTCSFDMDGSPFGTRPFITDEYIGKIQPANQGIGVTVDKDYFGEAINATSPVAGPLADIKNGRNTYTLWPRNDSVTPPLPPPTASNSVALELAKGAFDQTHPENTNVSLKLSNILESHPPLKGTLELYRPGSLVPLQQPIRFEGIDYGETQNISLPYLASDILKYRIRLDDGDACLSSIRLGQIFADRAGSPVSNAPSIVINSSDQYAGLNGAQWGGPDDLSLVSGVKWDDEKLYVSIDVKDNVQYQAWTGGDIWQGDSIQLGIDLSRKDGSTSQNISELGFAMNSQGTVSNWRWRAPTGLATGAVSDIETQITRDEPNDLTHYQITIPFSALHGADFTFNPADPIGFSVLINENDAAGRTGYMEYTQGIGSSKDASLFGDLYLLNGDYNVLLEESAEAAVQKAVSEPSDTDMDIARNFINLLPDAQSKNALFGQLISEETITGIAPVNISTYIGAAPVLPENVSLICSDGFNVSVPVTWDSYAPGNYGHAGSFTVEGTVALTTIKAVAAIDVTAISSINPVNLSVYVGSAPVLPEKVTVVYGGNLTASLPVVWDSYDPDSYKHGGSFTVEGTVSTTSIKAAANITVLPITSINAVNIPVVKGRTLTLPEKVTVVYSDNATASVPAAWGSYDPASLKQLGSFTVQGTVQYTNIPAAANITVAAFLKGTAFGSTGTTGNPPANAFDGNTATFFDGTSANNRYAGIDLGTGKAETIVKIRFFPRAGNEARMAGGKFQGSNTSTSNGYTDLYTVSGTPASGWNEVLVTNTTAWRYLRYIGPSGAYGNVAEIEFYPLDPSAPAWPQGSALTASGIEKDKLTLTWTAAQDDVAVTKYRIYNGSSVIETVTGSALSFNVTNLTPETDYTFKVMAGDAEENWSVNALTVSATTLRDETLPPDTTAPTWPAGSSLEASGIDKNKLTLTWTAARDDTAVTGYRIYKGATLADTVPANVNTYNITGLLPDTQYTFRVEAGDRAENWSTSGPSKTATTLPGDIVPENIALGKYAYASSEQQTDQPASNAFDGNAGTRWASYSTDNEWIAVDLGAPYDLSGVKLVWEAAYGKAYKLQVSNDGDHWDDAYTEANSDGGTDQISLDVRARYIRMLGQQRATTYGFSIWEFEVYAKTAPVDSQAPTWPEGSALTAMNIGKTGLTLTWTPAEDNTAVTDYSIYNGGVLIETVTGSALSFEVTELTADTQYTFSVEAGDEAGNRSENGPTCSAATLPDDTQSGDITAPTWPEGSALTASDIGRTGLTLIWTAAEDDTAVTAYRIYNGPVLIDTVTGSALSFEVTGLTADTQYTFSVEAGDEAGNWSENGPAVTAVTLPGDTQSGDVTAPVWPEGSVLTASSIRQTGLTLNWTAAQDDTAVTGYRIYNGSTLINAVTESALSLDVTGLSAGTQYTFTVQAGDSAGNWTADGPAISVTTLSGSGNTGSGNGSPAAPPEAPKSVQVGDDGAISSAPRLDGDNRAVTALGADDIAKAAGKAKADADGAKVIPVKVKKVEGAREYVQEIPANVLNDSSASLKLQIATDFGTVTLPSNMLTSVDAANAGTVALSVAKADKGSIDPDLLAQIGDRPVLEINISANGKAIAWNNPDSPITISIPYTPSASELADPEHITVYYIDGSGNPVPVPTGKYDAATGTVTFETVHLSKYAVAFVKKTFGDIDNYQWAKKSIEVLASKGVISGTTASSYAPNAAIKRGDFILMLVRALGLTAKTEGNFADVAADAYYADALAVARKLEIASGTGDNKFNPEARISRQEMMAFVDRATKAAGKDLAEGTAAGLAGFADNSAIASYAAQSVSTLVKNGIIAGEGGRINPLGNATRAETAVIIYKIYNK